MLRRCGCDWRGGTGLPPGLVVTGVAVVGGGKLVAAVYSDARAVLDALRGSCQAIVVHRNASYDTVDVEGGVHAVDGAAIDLNAIDLPACWTATPPPPQPPRPAAKQALGRQTCKQQYMHTSWAVELAAQHAPSLIALSLTMGSFGSAMLLPSSSFIASSFTSW